jgi:hypothetical protein
MAGAPGIPAGPGLVVSSRSAGFGRHHHERSFSGYLSGPFGSFGMDLYPPGSVGFYTPGYVGVMPYGPSFRQITIYYGPSSQPTPQPVPVPVIQQPDELAGVDLDNVQVRPRLRDLGRGLPGPGEDAPRNLPGDPASVFRPVRPGDRDLARQPFVIPEPARAPRKPLPEPPPPADNPRDEVARLLGLGNAAFTAQEYGRAAQRFRQATVVDPAQPMPYFLLAQAQFALGKYRDAVASIHAGMRLKRDWPSARFPVRDLYGPNPADYTAHLRQLQDALAQNPADPVLLFLYAHQLWFDGQQDEARKVFRRAKAVAPDTTYIDRFLEVGPGGPVAVR